MAVPQWASRGFDRPVFGASSKNRLWLPKGTERIVVVLSDMPFCLWEHNLRQGNSYREYWTCIRSIDHRGCPMDEANKAYYIGFATCIDTSRWTRRDGTVVENQKKLLPLRGQMMEYFENLRMQAGGNLRGAVFKVSRGTFDKCPAIGDRWDLQKVINEQELLSAFGAEAISEIDYVKILEPKPYDMVQQRAARFSAGEAAAAEPTFGKPAAKPSFGGKPAFGNQQSFGGQQGNPTLGAGGLVNSMQQPLTQPQGEESDTDEIPF